MRPDLRLQYQLSSGAWIDCGPRAEEFLARCVDHAWVNDSGQAVHPFRATRQLTRQEVIAALFEGREMNNGGGEWYSNCRSGAAHEALAARRQAARAQIIMVRATCGHTVPANSLMSASLGSSCPDCYDRMSD